MRDRTIALGPGKADLLAAIRDHGSIADAARSLGMSYMRAWSLVQTMNGAFREPLVATGRGGATQGGAQLTANGRLALRLYRAMERDSRRAAAPHWRRLRALLR